MSKKKQPALNPLTCGHHEDALCLTIDFKRYCATCSAKRINSMLQHISPRALQHYVPLDESNAERVFNRLHSLHLELRQAAQNAVQARTGSAKIDRTSKNVPHPEFASVNRLQEGIKALKRWWAWKRGQAVEAVAPVQKAIAA